MPKPLLIAALLALSCRVAGAEPVVRHDLSVTLDPAKHRLVARDRMILPQELLGAEGLHVLLAAGLQVSKIAGATLDPCPAHTAEKGPTCRILRAPAGADAAVTIEYAGEIYDPPRQDEGMRFIVGDKCSGTIGPEGVYLHGGSFFYPTVASGPPALQLFDVEIDVPKGWQGVGQGKRVHAAEEERGHVSRWENPVTCDSLSITAGPYHVDTREWNGITLATFLFDEDKALAPAYLDAAQKFIAFYNELLCPYAFKQFSIVENFFATGFGMPSYTLLGRDVVKMAERYTGAVGLGHEILHCWWGNYVITGEDSENWCEGLTTYCANYLYQEKTEGEDKAREYRRHTSTRFSVLVPPGKDYPVRRFVGKVTEIDNEVGYGKCSMIFHQLRRRFGDEKFFGALKQVLARFGGRRALWADFRKVFEEVSGASLEEFFTEWLDRPGAPVLGNLVVGNTVVAPNVANKAASSNKLHITVDQMPEAEALVLRPPGQPYTGKDDSFKPWHLALPVRIRLHERTIDAVLEMNGVEGTLDIDLAAGEEPERVEIDPDFHVFRRFRRDEIAPCLNVTMQAEHKTVVLPDGGDAKLLEAYRGIAERLQAQGKWEVVEAEKLGDGGPPAGALLLLGAPEVNSLVKRLLKDPAVAAAKAPAGFQLGEAGVESAGKPVAAPEEAVLFSLHNPWTRGESVTVFYGGGEAGITRPARLLFYYGWDGFIAFAKGQVAARGACVPPLTSMALDLAKR